LSKSKRINYLDRKASKENPMGVPKTYERLKNRFPQIMARLEALGETLREEVSFNRREIELLKLVAAAAATLEGGVHSHARRALASGAAPEELEEALILLVNQIGFSRTAAAMTWVWDVLAREPEPVRITFQGEPLTLLGFRPEVGQRAPNFTVVDQDLKPVRLTDFRGKICVISSVPSLDTEVCQLQTRRFNEEASSFPGVEILTISLDLPFAQKRFCEAHKVGKVKVLSDYQRLSFAYAFSLLIKEWRLLARSVWVIDAEGYIRYRELVHEITSEPDYEALKEALQKLL